MFKKILVVLLIAYSIGLAAQSEQAKFQHLGFSGLAYAHILSIYKAPDGYVWLGGFNGLHKYNGYTIKSYVPVVGEERSISNHVVYAIIGSADGDLWLGTENGLNKFNPVTERCTRFMTDKEMGRPIKIRALLQDSSGVIWIGTFDEGLFRFDPKDLSYQQYTDHGEQPNGRIDGNRINCLMDDGQGGLWIGMEWDGISVLNMRSGKSEHIKIQPQGDNTVNAFYKDESGDVWIGTWTQGLRKFNKATGKAEVPAMDDLADKRLNNLTVRAICRHDDDHLWVGTFYHGLVLYNKKKGASRLFLPEDNNLPNHLSHTQIWSLLKDKEGMLWVGTYGGGVNTYSTAQHALAHYKANTSVDNRISSNNIISTVADDDGNLWLGTAGNGLNKVNLTTGKVVQYQVAASDRMNYIRYLFKDKNGRIWAGTEQGILYYHKPMNRMMLLRKSNHPDAPFRSVPTAAVSTTNSRREGASPAPSVVDIDMPVYTITQDDSGNLYFGFYDNGLWRLDASLAHNPGTSEFCELQPLSVTPRGQKFPETTIMLTGSDRHHNLWLYDVEKLYRYNLADGHLRVYSYHGISCMHVDKLGRLWFGTYVNGIARYEAAVDSLVFMPRQHAPTSAITNILSDTLGNLWLCSYDGITRYNPETGLSLQFDMQDGLQDNYVQYNTACQISHNKYVVAGKNGYNIFEPYQVKKESRFFRTVLTDFKIFNKSVTLDCGSPADQIFDKTIDHVETIVLNYDQSVITFEFAALEYAQPQAVRYAYMMAGFDQVFVEAPEGTRSATYTNLNPGNYKFLFKSTGNNGQWSGAVSEVVLVILPPFWMTLWFRSLMAVFALALVVVVYRQRIAGVKRKFILQQAEQERKIVKLKNERLQADLNRKQDEFALATMNLIRRHNDLEKVQNRIGELTGQLPESYQTQFGLFLKQLGKEKDTEMSWDEFIKGFDAAHNDFIKRFAKAYPQLSQKDLKLCAYLRMNLDNHDIASLLHVSLRTVETARYRIRKKMDMQSADTLNEFVVRY